MYSVWYLYWQLAAHELMKYHWREGAWKCPVSSGSASVCLVVMSRSFKEGKVGFFIIQRRSTIPFHRKRTWRSSWGRRLPQFFSTAEIEGPWFLNSYGPRMAYVSTLKLSQAIILKVWHDIEPLTQTLTVPLITNTETVVQYAARMMEQVLQLYSDIRMIGFVHGTKWVSDVSAEKGFELLRVSVGTHSFASINSPFQCFRSRATSLATESSLYRCLLLHIIADHGARLKTLISTWIVLYVLTYYRVWGQFVFRPDDEGNVRLCQDEITCLIVNWSH